MFFRFLDAKHTLYPSLASSFANDPLIPFPAPIIKAVFVINMFITENVVSRIEFFAPSTKEEANAQQTKLFFLLIITLSDDTLDKDGRESILTNLGLYDDVADPKQLAGSVTKNGIQYILEPLVQNDLLFGLSLYTSFTDTTGTN